MTYDETITAPLTAHRISAVSFAGRQRALEADWL
jgi:hypothetical protein